MKEDDERESRTSGPNTWINEKRAMAEKIFPLADLND